MTLLEVQSASTRSRIRLKLGDKIEITCEDNMELMSRYSDDHFDLAIVDSPYGIGEDGSKTKGRTFRKDGTARKSVDKRTGRKAVIYNTYKNGEWDSNYPKQKYFNELFRVSKKQIIWGINYILFDQSADSSGRIFWDKVNGDNDFSDGELAWTNLFKSVRQFEFMWNGMLQGQGIINGRRNQGDKSKCEKRLHPTQKPRVLYEWLLSNYAKEGDKILDTHLGSGSIALAAHNLGFDLTACELDKDYYDDSIKRIENHMAQIRMF